MTLTADNTVRPAPHQHDTERQTGGMPTITYSGEARDKWEWAINDLGGCVVQVWLTSGDLIDYYVIGAARSIAGDRGVYVREFDQEEGVPVGAPLFLHVDQFTNLYTY